MIVNLVLCPMRVVDILILFFFFSFFSNRCHSHGGLGDSCPKSGGQKGHGSENHVVVARRRGPCGGHWVPMGSRVDHGSHGLGLWNFLSRPG